MTIIIHLDSDNEKVTNLAVANAILEMCQQFSFADLKPTVIARAILLQVESEDEK